MDAVGVYLVERSADIETVSASDARLNPDPDFPEKYLAFATIGPHEINAGLVLGGAWSLGPTDAALVVDYPDHEFRWFWSRWPLQFGPVTITTTVGSSSKATFTLPADAMLGQNRGEWAIRCDLVDTSVSPEFLVRSTVLPIASGEAP
jgi:hypothetical protein